MASEVTLRLWPCRTRSRCVVSNTSAISAEEGGHHSESIGNASTSIDNQPRTQTVHGKESRGLRVHGGTA